MQQRERVLQHPAGPSTARRVRADPSVPNQSAAVCQTGKLRRNPFAQLMGEDVDNDEVSPLARPVAVLPKQNEVETASANALARLTPASGPHHHASWRSRTLRDTRRRLSRKVPERNSLRDRQALTRRA